jgi:hypothetical protein
MHFPKRFLASALLAAALLIAAFSLSALAVSPVKITNCIKATSSPKLLTLTCGDGNTVLKGLSWSSFGGQTAHARGAFVTNTCEPNCAEGKDVSYPVSVRASSPKACKGGTRIYSKLALVFTARTPLSISRYKHWTLGCPT